MAMPQEWGVSCGEEEVGGFEDGGVFGMGVDCGVEEGRGEGEEGLGGGGRGVGGGWWW